MFDYDPSLYSVFANGAYLATVDNDGNLTFVQVAGGGAALGPEEQARLTGFNLDGLRAAAEAPESVIGVTTQDGIPRRE